MHPCFPIHWLPKVNSAEKVYAVMYLHLIVYAYPVSLKVTAYAPAFGNVEFCIYTSHLYRCIQIFILNKVLLQKYFNARIILSFRLVLCYSLNYDFSN